MVKFGGTADLNTASVAVTQMSYNPKLGIHAMAKQCWCQRTLDAIL